MKSVLLIIISSILTSCAVVPKATHDADDARCNLITRKMELDTTGTGNVNCAGNDGRAVLICLGFVGTVAAASAIVSGSIVLAGNTVHWVEKQGRCDDSFLNTYIMKYNKSVPEKNNTQIKTEDSLSIQTTN